MSPFGDRKPTPTIASNCSPGQTASQRSPTTAGSCGFQLAHPKFVASLRLWLPGSEQAAGGRLGTVRAVPVLVTLLPNGATAGLAPLTQQRSDDPAYRRRCRHTGSGASVVACVKWQCGAMDQLVWALVQVLD